MTRLRFLLLSGAAAPLALAAAFAADGPPSETCRVPRLQAVAASPGASSAADLTRAEGVGLYLCLFGEMQAGYAQSGNRFAAEFVDWDIHNAQPFVSAGHGGRYVNTYANEAAAGYARLDEAGPMPAGAVLAMDSFSVSAAGLAAPGPLFLMEKMPAGLAAATGDWRYTLILPDGRIAGTSGGDGAAEVAACHECHRKLGGARDSLLPVPEEFRID